MISLSSWVFRKTCFFFLITLIQRIIVSLKLLNKTYIRIHKVSSIRYTIEHHNETIQAESESETTIFFWIESPLTDDIWMHETRTHKFDPSSIFTDSTSNSRAESTREINLDSWLYEGKVSRTKTDFYLLSKYILEHRSYRILHFCHTNTCIDYDSLYLIECIFVRRIDIFISEYSSWDDRSNRRF